MKIEPVKACYGDIARSWRYVLTQKGRLELIAKRAANRKASAASINIQITFISTLPRSAATPCDLPIVNALLSNGASGKDNHWLDDPEPIHFNIFIQYTNFC